MSTASVIGVNGSAAATKPKSKGQRRKLKAKVKREESVGLNGDSATEVSLVSGSLSWTLVDRALKGRARMDEIYASHGAGAAFTMKATTYTLGASPKFSPFPGLVLQ
jgi:hypothetical protein